MNLIEQKFCDSKPETELTAKMFLLFLSATSNFQVPKFPQRIFLLLLLLLLVKHLKRNLVKFDAYSETFKPGPVAIYMGNKFSHSRIPLSVFPKAEKIVCSS